MDDLISKSKLKRDIIANLPQGMIKVAFLDLVDGQPTVDEKEIIRKPFERVLERLEEEKDFFKYDELDYGVGSCRAFGKSIQVVRKECGISE